MCSTSFASPRPPTRPSPATPPRTQSASTDSVRGGVVPREDVVAEVVARMPPHGVHVVGPVLDVVVLDDEIVALYPVVVRLPRFGAARPEEVEITRYSL